MGSLYFCKSVLYVYFEASLSYALTEFDLCLIYRELTSYPFVSHHIGMLPYYGSLFSFFSLCTLLYLRRVYEIQFTVFVLSFLMYDVLR